MIKRKRKGKKGSIMDLLYMAVIGLFIAGGILIAYKVTDSVNSQVQDISEIPTVAKTQFNTLNNLFPTLIDTSFLLIMIFIAIGSLILASLVRIHPVFMVAFIIVYVFIIIFTAIASNVYQEMASSSELIAYADNLTMTTHIMVWLPLIIGSLGILLMIISYKNWRVAQEYG